MSEASDFLRNMGFQVDAYAPLKKHPTILLYGQPGCLDAETFIPYIVRSRDGVLHNSKGGTIERLYHRFNGLVMKGKGAYQREVTRDAVFFLSSIDDEGLVRWNEITGVVQSGNKECFELTTSQGRICATEDHKFWTGVRYVKLADLRVGDTVYMHDRTIKEQADALEMVKPKRSTLYVKHHAVAPEKIVRDKKRGYEYTYHRIPRARLVVEAHMNNLTFDEYVDRLNEDDRDDALRDLKFLAKSDDVHHRDEDCSNDDISNLVVLNHREHARQHSDHDGIRFVVQPYKIESIESVGLRSTYDIQMLAPMHNFIANGFVVHNSGKTTELMVALQRAVIYKTGETVTRPYYSWLRELKPEVFVKATHDFKAANTAHVGHPDFEAFAMQAGLNAVQLETGYRALFDEIHVSNLVSNWGYFEQLKNVLVSAKAQGAQLPFDGIIIDEGSEVLRRIYAEMLLDPQFVSRKGVVDPFAVMREIEKWLINFCESFRAVGLLLAFTAQEDPPTLFEEKDSLHYGKQKYKGGPRTPFGSLRKTWSHALDICLRVTLQSGNTLSALPTLPPPQGSTKTATGAATTSTGAATTPLPGAAPAVEVPGIAKPALIAPAAVDSKTWVKRKYWTEAHPDWETKFRDFGISYQEDLGLRRLLERASYL